MHRPSEVLQRVGVTTEAILASCDYERLTRFGIRLEDLNQGDENILSLAQGGGGYLLTTLPLRRDAYARFVEKMDMPEWMTAFVTYMDKAFGPLADVRRNTGSHGLPWLQAYMVGIYGEEPRKWPIVLTVKDERRAIIWMTKMKFPDGVSVQLPFVRSHRVSE